MSHGTIFTGPAPFDFWRDERDDRFYEEQWQINHPDAVGKLYRVKGVESYAIRLIRRGAPIGLLVEEVEQA